jgi:hypothetical protein
VTTPYVNIKCPHCRHILRFDIRKSAYLRGKEKELQSREFQLAGLEKSLRIREAEHERDVRVIKGALHPDRHPHDSERYTRAWQAFERLLASSKQTDPAHFDDDIPF